MGGEDEGLIWTSKKSVSDDANQLVVRRPATPFFGHANVRDISVIMWLSPCPTEILSSFTCSNLIIISRSTIRTLMPTSSATYWPALVCFFFIIAVDQPFVPSIRPIFGWWSTHLGINLCTLFVLFGMSRWFLRNPLAHFQMPFVCKLTALYASMVIMPFSIQSSCQSPHTSRHHDDDFGL